MAARAPRRKFGASQKERIFFACLPDAGTAARIHARAEALKREHGFAGNLILPEHLHVTLFHLGDWIRLPDEIVALANRAAAEVLSPPFDVRFNKAESFRNRTGVYPFVLTGDKDAAPWRPLYDALGAALKRHGLASVVHEEFKPHVTLLRDAKRAKAFAVEPLGWTVRDFVLVHSVLGKTTHNHLARWPLPG
ncbi:MAG TPA: 2'-5' RNA ligase family protein [Rhizomicrobium sp.]